MKKKIIENIYKEMKIKFEIKYFLTIFTIYTKNLILLFQDVVPQLWQK